MDSSHRAGTHQRTLGMLFEHPLDHNIQWREVISLLESLGTAVEGGHDSLHVTVNNNKVTLQRPKHKDVGEEEIMQIRKFLLAAGVEPPHPSKGPDSTRAAP